MVKRSLTIGLILGTVRLAAGGMDWLPAGFPPLPENGPVLCQRDYLTPEQGAAVLQAAVEHFRTKDEWQGYADHLKVRLQEGAGLAPWPRRTELHAVVSDRRIYDGYSVENVRLEPVPGVYACGNLYRPLKPAGRCPAVLTTHGHTPIMKSAADLVSHGRFHEQVQHRAATLARMGAVVLTIDMFGYGDSLTQFGPDAHRTPLAMTMQLWSAIRAVDFLCARGDVDPTRIAVTGESGGATEGILLTALEPRIAVNVPVVMVSSYFFGGCPCESGRPIHRSEDHFANNAMFAALAAPRPMLIVSDGGDWTHLTPQVEFPFEQKIYALYGATDDVENVHLPIEGHNYGPSKRDAMYRFLAKRLGLDLKAVEDAAGEIDESPVTLESPQELSVFAGAADLPPGACRTPEEAQAALEALQRG